MSVRRLAAALVALAFASSSALAFQAEKPAVTGVWSGTLTVKGGEEDSIRVVLNQDGAVVTGTAGPDADRQYPIRKGRVTTTAGGVAVAFEVIVNGEHMAFDLKLAEGHLKGEARIEGEDGRARAAAVELKRAAPSPFEQ